jgi:hypothetical protein
VHDDIDLTHRFEDGGAISDVAVNHLDLRALRVFKWSDVE